MIEALDTVNEPLISLNVGDPPIRGAVVSEILNYNRFKTSSLGYANISKPNTEVNRWIIDDGKIRARQTTIFYALTDENNNYLLNENSEILTTD